MAGILLATFRCRRTSVPPELLGLRAQDHPANDPELPLENPRSMEVRIADTLLPVVYGVSRRYLAGGAVLSAYRNLRSFEFAVGTSPRNRRPHGPRSATKAGDAQFSGLAGSFCSPASPLDYLAPGLSAAMATVLFDVGTFHVGVLVATAAAMGLVFYSRLSSFARAARVNPIEALRDE